jgi:hypothetical protein
MKRMNEISICSTEVLFQSAVVSVNKLIVAEALRHHDSLHMWKLLLDSSS